MVKLPDKDDLLEDEEEQKNDADMDKVQAKAIMEIGEEKRIVWIDTGAEYSVIREDCYVKLKERNLVKECLPVTNVKLYGALGRKSERVSRQVLIEATHGGDKVEIRCLVVKGCFTDLIIGMDFMRRAQASINFHEGILRGCLNTIEGNLITFEWKLLRVGSKEKEVFVAQMNVIKEDMVDHVERDVGKAVGNEG